MMRRKLHVVLLLAAIPFCQAATAQLYIDNAQFFIQPGATVTVQGDVTSNVDIQGTGKVLLKGSSNQNVNMNGFTIPNLEVDNAANATLTGNAKVSGDVNFTSGKLQLGNYNLTLGNAATVSNATNAKYVVTNGTGKLVKTALSTTAFTYPVGNSTSTYNPVTISNSGTADDIAVRVLATANTAGLTGTAFTKEVVDATWDISEAVATGSNLSVTATWSATDELTGFNRTKAGISYYVTTPAGSVGWDLLNAQTGAAAGANPYTYTRTGITTLGAFAIGTRPVLSPLLVTPKVFLQGAYNSGNGSMDDKLRTSNLIPTTEPYSSGEYGPANGFTHVGSGGGETTTAAIVGSGAAAGLDAIVDWVFVELRQSSNGAVVSTRSALLQRDGDIVETDGVTPLSMAGNAPGSYYIAVRHRNHLGVRTAATITLAKTTNSDYNFKDAQNKAFAGAVANNPMATLTAGTAFGMWAGNANIDASVKMTGLTVNQNDYLRLLNKVGSFATVIPSTYSKQDLNMDGTVRMTGLTVAANDYLRLLNVVGAFSNTVTQPTF